MRRYKLGLLALGLPLLMGAEPSGCAPGGGTTVDGGTSDGAPSSAVPFTATFKRDAGGTCSSADFPVIGYAPPAGTGKHPLLIYTVGTLDNFQNPVVHAILRAAAERGFVAVSANYDNNFVLGCDNLAAKAKCLYAPGEPASLAAKMCGRADVDCSRGIAVAGHSQGAQLALVAGNHHPEVRAAVGLGATCDYFFGFGAGDNPGICDPAVATSACLLDASTALPADRIRLVDGLDEVCYSTSTQPCGLAAGQGELQRMSGRSCGPEAMSCLAPNGSGWLVVPNTVPTKGSAHHTWFADDQGVLDPSFAPPSSEPWSLGPNLDWLRAFTAP
jgi:pimeloyl-ACP methyl ester carboxylesterase